MGMSSSEFLRWTFRSSSKDMVSRTPEPVVVRWISLSCITISIPSAVIRKSVSKPVIPFSMTNWKPRRPFSGRKSIAPRCARIRGISCFMGKELFHGLGEEIVAHAGLESGAGDDVF